MGAACCQGDSATEKTVESDEFTTDPYSSGQPCGPLEAKVADHPSVRRKQNKKGVYYVLDQTFAVVRHADRMDHEDAEWNAFSEKDMWPNDTPLSSAGHPHAQKVGEAFKALNRNFGLVISSPYLRCAQTAAHIASASNVPVQFDLDMGEIFDNVSMQGDIAGKHQNRSPEELEEYLKEYPDVHFIRDSDGRISIAGKLQKFPEGANKARMRFCYKTKTLVQQAVAELTSIVIVTHGDAVAAVGGMLRSEWNVGAIPYAGFVVASRQVKVLDTQNSASMCSDGMAVFQNTAQWEVKTSAGLQYAMKGRTARRNSVAQHDKEVKAMNKMAGEIKTRYQLQLSSSTLNSQTSMEDQEEPPPFQSEPESVTKTSCKESLVDLGATGEDADEFVEGLELMDSHIVARVDRSPTLRESKMSNFSNQYVAPEAI